MFSFVQDLQIFAVLTNNMDLCGLELGMCVCWKSSLAFCQWLSSAITYGYIATEQTFKHSLFTSLLPCREILDNGSGWKPITALNFL